MMICCCPRTGAVMGDATRASERLDVRFRSDINLLLHASVFLWRGKKRGVSREDIAIFLSLMTLPHHFWAPSGHYYPQPPWPAKGKRGPAKWTPYCQRPSETHSHTQCVRCGQPSPLSWHQKLIVVLQTPFISTGLGCIRVCACKCVCVCVCAPPHSGLGVSETRGAK